MLAIAIFVAGLAIFAYGVWMHFHADYGDALDDRGIAAPILLFVGSNLFLGTAFVMEWIT